MADELCRLFALQSHSECASPAAVCFSAAGGGGAAVSASSSQLQAPLEARSLPFVLALAVAAVVMAVCALHFLP